MKNIKSTYTEADYQADNLQDQYTIMYGILGKTLIEDLGYDGEAVLREATRRYARDRGLADRKKHEMAGCKVNMYSAFNISAGLPGNKRTVSYRYQSKPQQHISHVLTCPMAEIWDRYGCFDIGRIYCEEFHFTYYNTYAFGKAKVNLATTLTERGTDCCSFNVILRPSDLPEELRPRCFEEYDSEPKQPDLSYFKPISAQEGYGSLYLRLYYYLVSTACESAGEAGKQSIMHGLHRLVLAASEYIRTKTAKGKENAAVLSEAVYLELNYPARLNVEKESMWNQYSRYCAKEIFRDEFCRPFMARGD